MTDYTEVKRRIEEAVGWAETPSRVSAYFNPANDFAGATFNTIGSNPPDEFGRDDLLAVALLETPLGGSATRRLLDEGAEFNRLLSRVPDGTDIWDAEPSVLKPGRPADTLWNQLVGLTGVGPTRAGKLMARKRPRLIPIVDDVVEGYLQAPPGRYWLAIQAALQDSRLLERIESLRPEEDAPKPDVTTLRLLDVIIWMGARRRG